MAIFHLDFKIVKRSEGRSSVAKAAYHARCRITDERTGDTYDYSRRTDLCGHFILAPVNAPEHIVKDSTALWNEVERVERQQNAYIERYNRTVRYDWLGQHLFSSLDELQDYATRWQWFYNHKHPNMALNGFTPMQHIQRMT